MRYLKKAASNVLFLALLLPLLFVGVEKADAQNLKVGYTDQELIIAQMPEYRNILTQLQQFAEGGQQEYTELVEDFQRRLEDYQRKQSLLSDEARRSREEELTQKQAEIQEFLQGKEREMGEREMELLQPLLERVEGAINEVAQAESLDLVFAVRAGQAPIILYSANESMDITQQVMNRLGITPPAGAEGR